MRGMIHLGVDWAGKGWLSVTLSPGGDSVDFWPSFYTLLLNHRGADRILVDIPIGLHESGRRRCDRRARETLPSPLKSSVYWIPIRPAVYARNLLQAKQIHRRKKVGFGISNQAWAIVPRIREVDLCLRTLPEAKKIVRETHPELGFRRLGKESAPRARKRTDRGRRERERILTQTLTEQRFEALKQVFMQLTRPDYAPMLSFGGSYDDFLDGLVAAVCARKDPGERRTLPEEVPTDSMGLPMAIYY